MICEFGYNCRHYLPKFQKCRKLIDKCRVREELLAEKWLGTQDTLVYLNSTNDAVIKGVVSGEIAAKFQKDRKLMVGLSVAWQYDDCYLKDSAGVCLYFEQHSGRKIFCLADLKHIDSEHPNYRNMPKESDIRTLENDISKILWEQETARPSAVDGAQDCARAVPIAATICERQQ